MLSVFLNITGIALIIYSILIIKKDISKNIVVYNDLRLIQDQVIEYYNLTEKTIVNFHEIIDAKLDIIDNEKSHIKNEICDKDNLNVDLCNKSDDKTSNLELIPLNKKILDLSSIGLTNEEIAKRLNKGKREIEIILKLYNNKK